MRGERADMRAIVAMPTVPTVEIFLFRAVVEVSIQCNRDDDVAEAGRHHLPKQPGEAFITAPILVVERHGRREIRIKKGRGVVEVRDARIADSLASESAERRELLVGEEQDVVLGVLVG